MERGSVVRGLYAFPVASSLKSRNVRGALLLAACAASALLTGPAHAQSVNQPLAPTREEIERRQPVAPPPSVRIEGELERAPCALDEPQFADVRFTLRSVEFGG